MTTATKRHDVISHEDQERSYTVTTPDGITDYFYADSMVDAYLDALGHYGDGITIRESWYKEWTCGTYEPGKQCGYDKYGNHVTAETVGNE